VSEDTKKLLRRLLTKDPTRRIEWMELLKVNITAEGKLVGNKQERLSLVEEDGSVMEGAKLAESGSFPTKEEKSLSSSTQAYSPPSTQ
jgi:serine/threonine protein kinase